MRSSTHLGGTSMQMIKENSSREHLIIASTFLVKFKLCFRGGGVGIKGGGGEHLKTTSLV